MLQLQTRRQAHLPLADVEEVVARLLPCAVDGGERMRAVVVEHAPQRRRPAPLGEPGLDFLSIRDHLFHLTVTSFDDVRRLSRVQYFDATARSVRIQLGHQALQSLILVPDKVLVGHDVRSVAGHVTRQFFDDVATRAREQPRLGTGAPFTPAP